MFLYLRKRYPMSIQLDHEEGTGQPHGESTGFYDPVQRAVITNECPWCRSIFSTRRDAQHHACSSFLRGFCRGGGSHVQTEVKQPLLPVVCPLCEIEEIANQESESSSLPHAESVSLQFSSVSDYYDHIIRCHLSLPGIPRARQKLHSFVALTMLPWRDLLRLAMRAE